MPTDYKGATERWLETQQLPTVNALVEAEKDAQSISAAFQARETEAANAESDMPNADHSIVGLLDHDSLFADKSRYAAIQEDDG